MEKKDSFWQNRKGMYPILLEVLEVEETIPNHDICKVRWYVLSRDKIYKSVFPMATMGKEFANFDKISRKTFTETVEIVKEIIKEQDNIKLDSTEEEKNEFKRKYSNAKRRILRKMKREFETKTD